MGVTALASRHLVLAAVALCAFSGCGSHSQARGAGERPSVHIAERDFHISAPRHVTAGEVGLSVHNTGPDDHELVVVRAGSKLPLRRDGLTVDEDAVKRATLGAVEPAPPGATHLLRVHLKPGRYELLCNMSGHYMGGMRTRLVVQRG